MKSLLDPKKKDGEYPFKYVPALNTNVRETFERVRREANKQDQPKKEKVA